MILSATSLLLAVLLLASQGHSGLAQRSSPQFSIPAAGGGGGGQFGSSDIFASSNGQDASGQPTGIQFEKQQPSSGGSSQSGSSSSSSSSSSSLSSSSSPSSASFSASLGRQAEQQSQQLQFLRPSQQQQQSQSASSQQRPSAAAQPANSANSQQVSQHLAGRNPGGSQAAASQPQVAAVQPAASSQRNKNLHNHHHSSGGHHAQTQTHQTPSASSHHSHNTNQNLHGLQTQITSQALHAQNNPGSGEVTRKAQATAASIAAASGQSYQCPDSFGYFRHHKSCDKYWACDNGTATLKLCGNGLNFDDSDPKRENCAYPFSVDCGADRTELEAPISTTNCPRLYGLFADNTNCRIFYSCWNGESSKYECPPGLAYDNEQRVCVWADLVDRCDSSEVSDGFVCPDPTEADQPGHYTRHAHPTDCRKFYVCIEGVARPYGCSLGTVFNVDSLQCDEPDNVSGCEKYYGDLDPKVAKKLAREGAQASNSNQPPASSQSGSTSSRAAGKPAASNAADN